ncbi:hypothetical protein Raf01_96820 [Rugosimonospora africana]|uniref:Transposase Helix-turn-helix domain-containing protein n=1 Tax=Rugosimonospora africana TaxID=556532 RepID=A0A8J3R1Z6_9ACTN|nr:hypothetical protein Raf01_96820 [Rugosimonospora africana]
MLSHPAAIPLSTASLTQLSQLLRTHRAERGIRWRRLDPGRQALLVLAHARNGDTYSRLAAGFGISIARVLRSRGHPPHPPVPGGGPLYRCIGLTPVDVVAAPARQAARRAHRDPRQRTPRAHGGPR